MQKMCAKMVPRLLAEEQKVQQLNACQDIFQQLEADDKLLENVITGDESWVFNMTQKKNTTKSPVEKCVLTQTKEGPHAMFASESDVDHLL